MYRIFYLLLLIPFTSFAQTDSTFETSQLEKMVMEPGGLIRMQTDVIGEVGNVFIGAIAVNDLNNAERQTALCFAPGGFNSPIFSAANLHIDGQEINELIAALEKFRDAINDKNNTKQQLYQFTSSNLIKVSLENRFSNHDKWDISICRRYKYLNATEACLIIRGKDLDVMINAVNRFIMWEKDSVGERQ